MDPFFASEETLPAGTLVGEHVVRGVIGAGGCATVYRAEHVHTGAAGALKILHRRLAVSAKMIARFAREVEVIRLVSHPGIVVVDTLGQLADGRPYYVMELLEGVTLAALARELGRFSPREALEIMAPLCAALEAVHRAGIVHRDIKASNVFVVKPGGGSTVKVLDFGIAKLLRPESAGAALTTGGRKLGTPSAMAPEQILGLEVDARADVYALGVLLFRMLTGRAPFVGETLLEVESGHLGAPPSRPSLMAPIDRAVDAVVLRCLEKHPDDRYRGVLPFLDDLRGAIERGPASPIGRAGGEPPRRALGVHVEVRAPAGSDQDAVFDAVGEVLDAAEHALLASGFSLAVQTGSSLLAVRALGATPAPSERRRAVDVASALHASFAGRGGVDPQIDIQICVHEDQALMGPSPLGERVLGGPILCLGAWVPAGQTGLTITPALGQALVARARLAVPGGGVRSRLKLEAGSLQALESSPGVGGAERRFHVPEARRHPDGQHDDPAADATFAEPASARRPLFAG